VSGKMTAMLPLPLATMLFRYFIVVKLVLNVLSLTVLVAAELTLGNIVRQNCRPMPHRREPSCFEFHSPQPIRGINTMPDFNLHLVNIQ